MLMGLEHLCLVERFDEPLVVGVLDCQVHRFRTRCESCAFCSTSSAEDEAFDDAELHTAGADTAGVLRSSLRSVGVPA